MLNTTVSLLNTGTASAYDLVVQIMPPTLNVAHFGEHWDQMTDSQFMVLTAKQPLHPLRQIPVIQIQSGIVQYDAVNKSLTNGPDMILVTLNVYARDTEALTASLTFDRDELANQRHKRTGFRRVQYRNPLGDEELGS